MAMRVKTKLIITLFAFMLFLGGCADMSQYGKNTPWGGETNRATVVTPTQEQISSQARVASPSSATNEFATLPAVNVAILLPLSGPQSSIGEALLQSAQLALFDIGYTNFNLMPRDTMGNAAGASAAASSAINDGAQIIIGPLFAESVRAVKTVAKPANINVIAFSTDWALADQSTYLMGFMPFAQVDHVAKYAAQKGYKNFAVIAPNDSYGNLVSERFTQRLRDNGGQTLQTIRITPNDPAIMSKIATLQNDEDNPLQAVFMPVNGSQTAMISTALNQQGFTADKVKRIGTGLWDDPRIADQKAMNGAWFAAPSPQSRQAFERQYQNTYGTKPFRLATLSYDATALVAALAKNGFNTNGHPAFNSTAITNRNGYSGIDGVFRFAPNGTIERQLSILEINNGRIIEVEMARRSF